MNLIENSQQLISRVVYDYLKFYFTPRKIASAEGLAYIYENALHLNLGKNVDHIDYAIYLAQNYPYSGILVKDHLTYKTLKRIIKPKGSKRDTLLPRNVHYLFNKLPEPLNLLLILEASKFRAIKMNKIINLWTAEKPLILLG